MGLEKGQHAQKHAAGDDDVRCLIRIAARSSAAWAGMGSREAPGEFVRPACGTGGQIVFEVAGGPVVRTGDEPKPGFLDLSREGRIGKDGDRVAPLRQQAADGEHGIDVAGERRGGE